MSPQEIDDLIRQNASAFGIPYPLLKAQAEHESNLNPLAVRYEPTYRWTWPPPAEPGGARVVKSVDSRVCNDATELVLQKTSFGLLQVMGAVARELGFHGASLITLAADPVIGLAYGIRQFKRMMGRYDDNVALSLAAYNSGSPTNPAAADYVRTILARAAVIHDEEASEV